MKVAIMQPYVFPYLGYFQMVNYADVFVSYDTADYIQRGWINRNRILIGREAKYFTVPVKKAPLGTSINEIEVVDFIKWKTSFLKTLNLSYKKSAFFESTYQLVDKILSLENYSSIAALSFNTIKEVSNYLELETDFISSVDLNIDNDLSKEEKLNNIITKLDGSEIILPPNSVELYKDWSPVQGIKKTMVVPGIKYNQMRQEFVSNLSVLDVLMHNDKKEVVKIINSIKFL